MVRRSLSILFAVSFLCCSTGAALDLHEHESASQHAAGKCAVCAQLASHAGAVVGEIVSWCSDMDARPEHSPRALSVPTVAAPHHAPASPRAPPSLA